MGLNPDHAVFTAAILLAHQHKQLDLRIAHDLTPEDQRNAYVDTHYVRIADRPYRVRLEPLNTRD